MRQRSQSLFQPTVNSTTIKFEGIENDYESDDESSESEETILNDREIEESEAAIENDINVETDRENDSEDHNSPKFKLLLIEKIKSQIPDASNEDIPIAKRLKKIDWNEIGKSLKKNPKECEEIFLNAVKSMKNFKTLQSVLINLDVYYKSKTSFSDFPKQPLTAYNFFMKSYAKKNPKATLKDYAEAYKKLKPKKLEEFKILSQKAKEEYNVILKEFRKNHPEIAVGKRVRNNKQYKKTPFRLFFMEISQTKNISYKEATQIWKNDLTVSEKVKYIKEAYQTNDVQVNDLKGIISKKEKRMVYSIEKDFFKNINKISKLKVDEKKKENSTNDKIVTQEKNKIDKVTEKEVSISSKSNKKKLKEANTKKDENDVQPKKRKRKSKADEENSEVIDVNPAKKSKKENGNIVIKVEPDSLEVQLEKINDTKPAGKLLQYYKKKYFKGKNLSKAKSKWRTLPYERKKEIKKEYDALIANYLATLRAFIKTISSKDIGRVKKLLSEEKPDFSNDMSDVSDEFSDSSFSED